MNPDEGVKTHIALQSKKTMGIHFETFLLTDEAHDAPRKALAESLKSTKLLRSFLWLRIPVIL